MNYNRATLFAVTGETLFIPGWEGYFRWNYGLHYLEFINGDFRCPADQLDIKNRTDFCYII